MSEAEPRLFTGALRDELDPWGTGRRRRRAARGAGRGRGATTSLEALPDGLDAQVDERGRAFSGGQRQRLRWPARCSPTREVLVLVEPTSAVDAHTEARIAQRLRAARHGAAAPTGPPW